MLNPIENLLKVKISLSPLAGVSDLSFRLLCRKYGCKYAFTEMIDARAILYANRKTFNLLNTNSQDKPLAVQIIGADADEILSAALICEKQGFDMININAACPSLKVKKKKKGSFLLKDSFYIGEIIKKLVKNINIPVVLKIRSGFDEENINYLEIGKIAEEQGAKAIFIHPRTAIKKYKGDIKKEHIIDLKKNLSIPIIANGNIFSEQSAKAMFDDTNCDGISIARGCFGRPWIFKDIEYFLENNKLLDQPDLFIVKNIILEHFEIMLNNISIEYAIPRMYKHIVWYLNRFKLDNLKDIMKIYHEKVTNEKEFKLFLEEF